MLTRINLLLLLFLLLLNESCTKQPATTTTPPPPPPGISKDSAFNYGDSIFYRKDQSDDYIITPFNASRGKYFSFPDGLVLDGNSGEVNISKSETGLKYAIAYIPDGKTDTSLAFITISGINYADGFYNLADGDSIAHSIYDAIPGAGIPGINSGSVFDVGSNCNDQGCNVNVANGSINLAQTVRNGVFGSTPSNNDRHEFEMTYKLNDKSNGSENKLKVKLYYFKTMNDVTPEADSIISSRQGSIIGPGNTIPALAFSSSQVKPRPPCIFIVGH